ncbi:MAG: hypothetical protein ACK5PP_07095 [Acidimicrobiales bacterium]
MLDHVFTDAIGALRDALESAMLERQAFEERFQADVLLGDVSWETSYGLPGEGSPPRVQVDLSLDWPTWAQTAYRTWYVDEEFTEGPRIEIEVVFRVQRLAEPADPAVIMKSMPETNPLIGNEELSALGPTLEAVYDTDLQLCSHAVEITYTGSYELDEETLEDGSALDEHFAAIGGWITSALVRLGDLPLVFQPPGEP